MKTLITVLAALIATTLPSVLSAQQPAGTKPDEPDLAFLQGTWVPTHISSAGRTLPKETLRSSKYAFDDNQMITYVNDKRIAAATITLSPASKPKSIDVVGADSTRKRSSVKGIYKIEGDIVTICFGKTRPKTFDSSGENALMRLKRTAQLPSDRETTKEPKSAPR